MNPEQIAARRAVQCELLIYTRGMGECLLMLLNLMQSYDIDIGDDPQLLTTFRKIQQFIPVSPPKIVENSTQPAALAQKSAESQPQTPSANLFRQLQLAVRNGTAVEKFPIGTEIPDVWTDVKSGTIYDAPLIVVDYRELKTSLTQTQFCATLLRKYLAPDAVPFDISSYDPEYADSWINTRFNPTQRGESRWAPLYVRGCSRELMEVISPVIIYTYERDRGVKQHYLSRYLVDNFFIPDEIQLNFSREPYDAKGEISHTWQYFQDELPYEFQTQPWREWHQKRVFCDHTGQPHDYWLRDHARHTLRCRSYACQDGSTYFTKITDKRHLLPACVVA